MSDIILSNPVVPSSCNLLLKLSCLGKNALMGSFIKKLIGKKNRGEKTNYFFRDYRHDSLPTQCPSWISTIAIAVKSRDHKQKNEYFHKHSF